jgi:hypothetical protein
VASPGISKIHLVYAQWCGHCVPTAVEALRSVAGQGSFELHLHDVDDPAGVSVADALVRSAGDWCPDYLVPQVFLDVPNRPLTHLLTGYPEAVSFTRTSFENLRASGVWSNPVRATRPDPIRGLAVPPDNTKRLIEARYRDGGACLHCERKTTFERIEDLPGVVYAQVCPTRYVTRVIEVSQDGDPGRLFKLLRPFLVPGIEVESSDFRVATRYDRDWSSGHHGRRLFRQAYWTQYYRVDHPKRIRPHAGRRYLYWCDRSRHLFRSVASARRHCPECEGQ